MCALLSPSSCFCIIIQWPRKLSIDEFDINESVLRKLFKYWIAIMQIYDSRTLKHKFSAHLPIKMHYNLWLFGLNRVKLWGNWNLLAWAFLLYFNYNSVILICSVQSAISFEGHPTDRFDGISSGGPQSPQKFGCNCAERPEFSFACYFKLS